MCARLFVIVFRDTRSHCTVHCRLLSSSRQVESIGNGLWQAPLAEKGVLADRQVVRDLRVLIWLL